MDITTAQVQEAARQLRLIVDRPAIATRELSQGRKKVKRELRSNLPDGYVAIVDNENRSLYTRMPLETFKTLLTMYEDQIRKGDGPKLLKKVMSNEGQLFTNNKKLLDIVQRHGESIPYFEAKPIQKVKKKVVVKGKQKKLGVKASEKPAPKPAPKPKPVKKKIYKKYRYPEVPEGYEWRDVNGRGELLVMKLKGFGHLNYDVEDKVLLDHYYDEHKYSDIERVIDKLESEDIEIEQEQEEVELSPEYKRYTYQGVPYFVIMEEGDYGPYEVLNDELQQVGEKFHDSAKIHFVNPSVAAEHRRHPKYKPT